MKAFYFDMTRCIGCRTCQVACKDRQGLMEAGPMPRRVTTYEAGEYPNAMMYHISMGCNECRDPMCARSCPTGATFRAKDGTMRYDPELCIGCYGCVNACPYQAPQRLGNGKIARCDSCFTLRERGMKPVCVDACIMRCLDFDEVEVLKEKYGEELVSDLAPLYRSDVTHPNLYVRAKRAALDPEYREVLL